VTAVTLEEGSETHATTGFGVRTQADQGADALFLPLVMSVCACLPTANGGWVHESAPALLLSATCQSTLARLAVARPGSTQHTSNYIRAGRLWPAVRKHDNKLQLIACARSWFVDPMVVDLVSSSSVYGVAP
jgi:hypothetical protein